MYIGMYIHLYHVYILCTCCIVINLGHPAFFKDIFLSRDSKNLSRSRHVDIGYVLQSLSHCDHKKDVYRSSNFNQCVFPKKSGSAVENVVSEQNIRFHCIHFFHKLRTHKKITSTADWTLTWSPWLLFDSIIIAGRILINKLDKHCWMLTCAAVFIRLFEAFFYSTIYGVCSWMVIVVR